MSGVRNFIGARGGPQEERQSTPPPQQRHGRLDRLSAARDLKVKRGEKAAVNSQTFGQQLHTTMPTPAFRSNSNPNYTATRNSFPNSQYQQFELPQAPVRDAGPDPQFAPQQEGNIPAQGGVFDDTLTSGLEDTKSDVHYNGDSYSIDNHLGEPAYEDGDGQQDEEARDQYINPGPRQSVRSNGRSSPHINQHGLQHKHSRSPLIDKRRDQQPNPYVGQPSLGISGRFQAPVGERWQQDIAHHGVVRGDGSNKRGHPNKPDYEDDDQLAQNQQREMVCEESGEEDYDDDSPEGELPEHQDNGNGGQAEQAGRQNGVEPGSEGAQTAVSAVSRVHARRDELYEALRTRRENEDPFKLDHEDEDLQSMDYADLKKEIWDAKPSGEKRPNPAQTTNTEFTPEDCFFHMVHEEDAEGQLKFFEEMTMAEYEEAGDFFIEQFTVLMKKIKDARKKKREIVAAFEKEIETREKAVRGKSGVLEQKFETMRAGGESVLRSKV